MSRAPPPLRRRSARTNSLSPPVQSGGKGRFFAARGQHRASAFRRCVLAPELGGWPLGGGSPLSGPLPRPFGLPRPPFAPPQRPFGLLRARARPRGGPARGPFPSV